VRELLCIILTLIGVGAHAEGTIPRCWSADQPGQAIQDGMFRFQIPTDRSSARDVAEIMLILSQSLAGQVGAGSLSDLSAIEIDMNGETKYWQPTAAFPTLDSFKTAILNSMMPVMRFNIIVECAMVNVHIPTP
jgi:hypothetical protein